MGQSARARMDQDPDQDPPDHPHAQWEDTPFVVIQQDHTAPSNAQQLLLPKGAWEKELDDLAAR